MPQFVIHQHILADNVHWDLMLEDGPALVTWQVDIPPEKWPGCEIPCRKIADHRLKYLDYEGPVSRGRVRIVAAGRYELLESTPTYWKLNLLGESLQGMLVLASVTGEQWQLKLTGENCENH